MNRVCIIGRLTNDIELRKTNNGKDVCSFTIAVDRIGDGTDFIMCTAWNRTAEFLSNYAKKGNKVSVDGKLQTRSYENSNGQKVNVVEIMCEFVDLLEQKQKEQKEQNSSVILKKNNYSSLDITDDDLPF